MERSGFELFDLVDVHYEGRTLQMRPSQLTVANIARTFRLIPETIFLVSERGTVALPTDGVFDDVDQCFTWSVEGDKSTANRAGAISAPGKQGSDRWKPQAFPLAARSSRSSNGNGSGRDVWNKSIGICSLKGDTTDLVACSEHPVSLEDGTANVPWIQEKLSGEAFSGARIRLLNAKNIPIADTEGTRGPKFWKTAKIVKAIAESDYNKLQRIRIGQPGPSSVRSGSPILLTDSDSEPLRPLIRKKKRFHIPPPPQISDSDSPGPPPTKMPRRSSDKGILNKILESIDEIKQKLEKTPLASGAATPSAAVTSFLKEVFTCIVCKQVVNESSRPIMPPCCKSIVCCSDCLSQWVDTSPICPHCRSEISLDSCVVQPLLRPLFEHISDE